MAPPIKQAKELIHVPTVLYWIGFWVVGIYGVPLVFSLAGFNFDASFQLNWWTSLSKTIRLAGFSSIIYQMVAIFTSKPHRPQDASVFYRAFFWGILWTIVFFSDRLNSPCAVGIDSSACQQLHVIGLMVIGPIVFLYNTVLGLIGSLLADQFFRQRQV